MIKKPTLLLMIMTLVLAACSSCLPTQANSPQAMMNTSVPMNFGNMMSGTATPGSMMATNPEAAHMMEPITAPKVQPAAETTGEQLLAYQTDMSGMSMAGPATEQGGGKYAIRANFSMSGNWAVTVYVRKGELDVKQEIPLKVK